MGFLARMQARKGGPRGRFLRELRSVYLDARRLAAQLRSHSARASYPAHAVELRRLGEQADAQAAALAEALRALAGNMDPSDRVQPRDGRNHWERLSVDLTDLEALRRRLTDIALHHDVDFATAAATIARLARATAEMSEAVRGLLARSDPHAA